MNVSESFSYLRRSQVFSFAQRNGHFCHLVFFFFYDLQHPVVPGYDPQHSFLLQWCV